MKASDIRELTEQELSKSLEENLKELLTLKIQKQTGQLANTAQITAARKNVARLKTEVNSRNKTA